MAETQQTHHRLATPRKTLQTVAQESPDGCVVLPTGAQPPERDDQCYLHQELGVLALGARRHRYCWVVLRCARRDARRLRLAQILAQHLVIGGRERGLGPGEWPPSGQWGERGTPGTFVSQARPGLGQYGS